MDERRFSSCLGGGVGDAVGAMSIVVGMVGVSLMEGLHSFLEKRGSGFFLSRGSSPDLED